MTVTRQVKPARAASLVAKVNLRVVRQRARRKKGMINLKMIMKTKQVTPAAK